MKRAIFVSLSLLFLGSIAGCGSAYNAGGGGGGNPTPNALSGQYAILLSGVDNTGLPLGIAGTISADGLGHISGGEIDVNDNGVPSTSSSVAGYYSFDTNGQSTLGTITLTNAVGTVAHPLSFGFSLNSAGSFGEIMDVDINNFFATGTMEKRVTTAFSLASMAGDYVVAINGRPEASPIFELGRFTLSAGGAGSSLAFDRSEAGTTIGAAHATTSSVLISGAGLDTNGRGTLTLGITDAFAVTSQTFAFYVVDTNRIVAVETDALASMTADFSRQQDSTAFTAATADTSGSVFAMAGVDTALQSDIATIGQLVITGTAPSVGNIKWDSTDNGAAVTSSAAGQAVTFDPTTGRGTLTVTTGTTNGLANTAVFYLTSSGQGFILDATLGTTNRALAGTLTPQATGPFSAATDLSGMGIVRGRGASANDPFSLVGLFTPSSTAGQYQIVYDDRLVNNNAIATFNDGSNMGITPAAAIDATGRGTFTNPDTNAFYVIGPNQFVFIDISALSNPDLFFVDQR
jgi:hypothetical protein